MILMVVPAAGLEPAPLTSRDFKSLASTDFATPACRRPALERNSGKRWPPGSVCVPVGNQLPEPLPPVMAGPTVITRGSSWLFSEPSST